MSKLKSQKEPADDLQPGELSAQAHSFRVVSLLDEALNARGNKGLTLNY